MTSKNETGYYGTYEITGLSHSGVASTDYGKVFVTSYYDGDSTKLKLPVVDAAASKGTNFLGSEKGYVKTANVPDYQFSSYYEADSTDDL